MITASYISEAKLRYTSLTRNEKKKIVNIKKPIGTISKQIAVIAHKEYVSDQTWIVSFQSNKVSNKYLILYIYSYFVFMFTIIIYIIFISLKFRKNVAIN